MDTPQSSVEIKIAAKGLPKMDRLSQSDPMAVLFQKTKTGKWEEVGRTEWIKDDANPKFVTGIRMPFLFESVQKLRIVFYDIDKDPRRPLVEHDLLGECECTLAEIMSSLTGSLIKDLSKSGACYLSGEELSSTSVTARLTVRGEKLDKKDFFGSSDPFYVISRMSADGSFAPVHKSPVIKKNLNPSFEPVTLGVQTLCNGDYDRGLMLEMYDWDSDGTHDLIGSCTFSLRQIEDVSALRLDLIHAGLQKKKKKYVNSGVVIIDCHLTKVHTFLDYIRGGCELNFMIGIDFTASNGRVSDVRSLHFRPKGDSSFLNEYERAIMTVGQVVQEYDTDKAFPIWGYGARVPNQGVSHCFSLGPLAGCPEEVAGLPKTLDVYRTALDAVILYGPTNFAPILRTASELASQSVSQKSQRYFVLLIITDGIITDMPQTVKAIVDASVLPLSIVIVGVGAADFSSMNQLDADDGPLVSQGRAAARDCVQFVPYREVSKKGGAEALARETLSEIPDQLLEYMRMKKIVPNEPPPSYQ